MTGPEHYLEGERLIAVGESLGVRLADDLNYNVDRRDELGKRAMVVYAQAQAHFAAALVAATISAAAAVDQPQQDHVTPWLEAIGP